MFSFESEVSVWTWVLQNGLKVVVLVVVVLFLLMVSFLLGFHVFLALRNYTTWEFLSWNKIEYLKESQLKVSPFSRGLVGNFKEYCCEKFPPLKQWEFVREN